MNAFLCPKIFARIGLWLLLSIGMIAPLAATHNLAGQITAEQDPNDPNKYRIRLTTYTDPAPAGVDRCAVTLDIYEVNSGTLVGSLLNIPRNNGPFMPTPLPGDCMATSPPRTGVVVLSSVKRNIYDTTFVFPGPGEYDIVFYDIARHGSVVNIDNGTEQSFSVITRLLIPPFIAGGNTTVTLLNEPLEESCAGKIWDHNPGAFDADGDSLAYRLRPSLNYDPNEGYIPGVNPRVADGFRWPDDPAFGNSTFTMDPITGEVVWEVPSQPGIYNFGYEVLEYRNGVLIGYVIRDVAVWVRDCDNDPPIIEAPTDTCVQAGDFLQLEYVAYDTNLVDSVYLQLNNGDRGNNGPFAVDNPATIDGLVVDPRPGFSFPYTTMPVGTSNNNNPDFPNDIDSITGTINWQTACENIRKNIYQVDLYATDNKSYSQNSVANIRTLSANHIITIKVTGPAPEGLFATKGERLVTLDWLPTFCDDYVSRYRVYRKLGEGAELDTVCCEMSPRDMGYDLLFETADGTVLSFTDSLNDLPGSIEGEICYAVTAIFDDPAIGEFRQVEGCAQALCVEIENDSIFMTHVSVQETDEQAGEMFVNWTQPSIDPAFPGPYEFILYRANNNAFPAIPIDTLPYTDTTFIDSNLNTVIRGYNYRVEIFDGQGTRIASSDGTQIASSIYLETVGGINQDITLTWSEFVPWSNSEYVIYRSDAGAPFVAIDSIAGTGAETHQYVDANLDPEIEYCYFIRSKGSYNSPGLPDSLINDSQEACDFARDDAPPCVPDLFATGACDPPVQTVRIVKPDDGCDFDTEFITLFFATNENGPYREVATIPYDEFGGDTILTFSMGNALMTQAGCYAVTATDSFGNESELGMPGCVDFCPELTMGNVFSPNSDGSNDFLRPVSYRDVVVRNVKIFDRWGRMMYEGAGDINELWDGRVNTVGDGEAEEGVYFYYLQYEELGINGNTLKELKGSVTLLR
ncbi:gliding motility-associated C-terminal domain-containing protein [Pontibacter sp. G13]|uniref:T9SS type B sorting domain-containing protein n=1 Tax=Pontibacter sp. G13 TaxID=3074898 RepID=UPI002889CCA5|nr:gliding motility-associated C-terminal domain-containing protein [Pontibacter sp. G13]WNJ16964.1 gliding motility-associated C-terminal domain-containing protein [Pontibacter sp. G13]